MTERADPPLDPDECTTMAQVRAGVDQVDRDLVALLTRRQGYMAAAARIKPQRADVRVPWRIEEVVEKVLAEAARTGLSARIAEPVWRELIERSIAYEDEHWRALRAAPDAKAAAGQAVT